MQRDKRGRFVSDKAWEKYNKAEIKRSGVDSTADNESADEKLQILDEVGVVDRCLDEQATVPSSYAVNGRRVVELEVLAKGLFCMVCRAPLSLSIVTDECRWSLGSTLFR
jgi:hypothetical protein